MTAQPTADDMPALLARPLAELPDPLPIAPPRRPFNADITPPGSKSLTNRALLLAALASGESILRRPLTDAVDAERMIQALRLMGADIRPIAPGERDCPDGGLSVRGASGRLRGCVDLELANAGTATRFLAAAAALADGPVVIDGASRMRERPIGDLAIALRGLGAGVEFLEKPDYPPLRITPGPPGEIRRSHLVLPTAASSQFISALLLIAPWTPRGLTLAPYIAMTLGLLARLGARDVKASQDGAALHVGPGPLAGFRYDVEPDASGASYFWAAAAITPGAVCRIRGLSSKSLQGDARFVDVLAAPFVLGIAPFAAGFARAHRRRIPAPRVPILWPGKERTATHVTVCQ